MKYFFTPSHLHVTESLDSTKHLPTEGEPDFNAGLEQDIPEWLEQTEFQVRDTVMRRLFLNIRLLSKKSRN